MNHKDQQKNVLICKSVKFYADTDESTFFEWVQKLLCIKDVSKDGKKFYLHVSNKTLNDTDLMDLLALFYRYKLDMKQLKVFLNNKNKKWFYDNKKAYWYKRVFQE